MKQINFFLKKFAPYFLSFVIAILFSISAKSQALDSKGTDFWLTFPGNYTGGVQLSFFISSDQNTTGTVSIPGLAFSVNFSVAAGTVTTVILPDAADLGAPSNVVTNKGVHVVALKEVTVYGLSRLQYTTDAYLGLPTDILGTQYAVLGYKNSDVVNGTQFAIVATENATTVTITPTLTTDGHPAGIPYNILLNQGQTYQVRNTGSAPNDLSGTIVTSNKPIGVFGGHQCANIPPGSVACDYVVEQLPPTTAWGKNFVTVPLKTRKNGDTFRFLAATNNTTVTVNGGVVATLNRGQLFETILTTASQITSTQPILVAQYSNGTSFDNVVSDPFMMLIPPYEQFLGNYTFATPATGFRFNFVNVVAPAAAVGTLKLDGIIIAATAFTPIGATGFSSAQLDLEFGAHTINGTSLPFGIFVYGFNDADSYGYPGGQSLAPIATATTIAFTPKNATSSVTIEKCFEAIIKDQFNNPVAGVRVDFNVTGVNPSSTGFANTNAAGIARYCYTGINPGTDNIVASLGTLSDAGKFVWTPLSAKSDYYSKASGDLHNVLSWGVNPDGSGATPADFGAGKTFHLVNRVPTYTMTANWTVGGNLDIATGSILEINGFTLSEAALIGAGMLSGTTASNLIVTGTTGGDAGAISFAGTGGVLNNLSLNRTGASASATIANGVSVYGVLTLTNGLLKAGNNITLKSNASNTARVAPVTGSIAGNVVVERYIPARRAWRIMSAPVGGNQSINAGWQEGATTSSAVPNPAPGFGTHITEGSAGMGFDHNPVTAMISVKKYVSATDSWTTLGNTNATKINSDAYLLFIRGHRGTPLGYNTVAPTNTVLRASGPLKTGDQTFPVSANGFTAIPNPFASPINFATLTRNNVQNNFYLWDPKMGGANGVGGYVLLSYNGSGYDITPAPVSPESQYIQSGQGFLVRSTGIAGSLVIKESDKSNTAATNAFRSAKGNGTTPPGSSSTDNLFTPVNKFKNLRVTLQVLNADNTNAVVDEVLTSYNNLFSNKLDEMDALKMPNINENLSIDKEGQHLMVERRSEINGSDTLKLNLWNTTQKDYILEFNPVNLSSTILSGEVVDKYLNTTTPISMDKITRIKFSPDENSVTKMSSRFMVILSSAFNTQPFTYSQTGIWAYPNPVEGKSMNLRLVNQPKGIYNVSLINSLGQSIYQYRFNHPGGNVTQRLQFSKTLKTGIYQLRVINGLGLTNLKILTK